MFYVGDIKKGLTVEIKNKISEKERDEIFNVFSFTGLHHQITEIKNIVLGNGDDFKRWMIKTNIQKCQTEGMSVEEIILHTNKSVLNYASSIRTYIDIEKTLLSKYTAKRDHFHYIYQSFYEKYMEFRFWVNFRNYIVHCAMPYTSFIASKEDSCQIICYKKHLLEFNHWRESKADIEAMPEQVDLVSIVDTMSSLILALYMDFYAMFAEDIIASIKKYAAFCRKYDSQQPVIIKTSSLTDLSNSQMQPFPVKKLYEAFSILKSNPNLKINIIE